MPPLPDGCGTSDGSPAGIGAGSSPGAACRLVQITLAIYLTPVIAAVLMVGCTAVAADRLARVLGRRGPRLLGGPIPGPKIGKDDARPHLANGPGRSRVAR